MADCRDIERALAPYVEGGGEAPDRARIAAHLETCPDCRARAAAERSAYELLRARHHALRACAPDRLRQRCAAASAAMRAPVPAPLLSRPWARLSMAATVVIAGGFFLLFGLGTSVDSYATQLAADHIKCFKFPPGSTPADGRVLGNSWEQAHGWPLRISDAGPDATEDLELVGLRRCGSTLGRVAHVLYRWRGQPLSVYVLNDRLPDITSLGRNRYAQVKKLGEQEIIWSDRGRTYAVVARASIPDLQRVATQVRRRIE
jgi:anti-sigma factor RsiW